ncbi:hypothetical protein [Budvicia aquatica]|uniref:Uncharacterized protein n=1 Tax=Budvicia aquatica TaxID=82979 RepID=A0A484ZHH0_9GAMM|nr:hypothetical protein [Budvicia aquatica]VFS45269.1 Uncharacterised protein [Budvicia aquatica]
MYLRGLATNVDRSVAAATSVIRKIQRTGAESLPAPLRLVRILAGRAIFLIPSATFVMLELKVKDEMGVEAVYQFLLLFFEFLRG